MKNSFRILAVVLLVGVFSVFSISCKNACEKKCCQTDACEKHCIDNKCCEEGATCAITGHDNCKQKCCNTTTEEACHIDEEKSCCHE